MAALRPEEIPDRSLFRERTLMTIWIVHQAVRFGFPSPEHPTYAGFKLSDPQEVEPGDLIRVPRVPPDGTLLQEFKTGALGDR